MASKTFLISRIDAIGDVVLTLPIAGWLKQHVPGARVLFLGRTYTAPVVACCRHVDAFLNWDEWENLPLPEQVKKLQAQQIDSIIHVFPNKQIALLAWRARIKQRIGTRSRWFHLFTVTNLVALSRRQSLYHESQLNLMLLQPLGLKKVPALVEVITYLDLSLVKLLPEKWQIYLQTDKPTIILHPKSRGHGREWSLEHYGTLAKQLHEQGWQVFISGAQHEHELLHDWLQQLAPWVMDLTGKLTLPEFISFMKACTGLISSGTGPLHVAAGLGIHALGLFPPLKPIHPGRWAPLGWQADYLVVPKECNACRVTPGNCACLQQISVAQVMAKVKQWREL